MSGKTCGPLCAATNPQYKLTPGPCGINDSADVDRPRYIPRASASQGQVLLADSRKAPPASNAPISPNARPTPLEELSLSDRNELFGVASRCFKEATGRNAKDWGDASALSKSSVVPIVSAEEWWKEYDRQFKGTGVDLRKSWKVLSGMGIPEPKARILMNPDFFLAAQKGGKWNGKNALLHYRDTYLEEQCHLYLHFRGVPIEQAAKPSEKLVGSGSCHHEAIPLVRKRYRERFSKKYSSADSEQPLSSAVAVG